MLRGVGASIFLWLSHVPSHSQEFSPIRSAVKVMPQEPTTLAGSSADDDSGKADGVPALG